MKVTIAQLKSDASIVSTVIEPVLGRQEQGKGLHSVTIVRTPPAGNATRARFFLDSESDVQDFVILVFAEDPRFYPMVRQKVFDAFHANNCEELYS